MTRPLPQAFAYILPLAQELLERLYSAEKDVILKFLPKESMGTRFQQGTIIVFYQTRSQRKLIGESVVQEATMLNPRAVHSRFGDSVLLSEQELALYVNRYPLREDKRILAIRVGGMKRYSPPVIWPNPMTMVGCFLNPEKYRSLIAQHQ